MISEDNLAVATSRHHWKSLNIREDIYCFDTSQSIHSYLKTFLIRSDFKMKNKFDNAVTQVMEAGLIAKWEKDFRFKRKINNKNEDVSTINIDDLLGALLLCGALILLATIVAGIERISFRKAHDGNVNQFWKWISLIIDGDRHFLVYELLYGPRSTMNN